MTKITLGRLWEKFQSSFVFWVLLAIWWAAAGWKLVSPAILPAPSQVVSTFIDLVKNGILIFNLKASLLRVISGFLIGASIGFVLGVLMGLSKIIEKLVAPSFHAIRQVPLLGWIPLIILWCGIGEISKIVFIALGAFYPVVLNTFQGIRSVKKEYIELSQVFEYSKIKLLRKVVFPAALPSILTGIRFSLSVSWLLVVGAEMFTAAAGGIGSMMTEGREQWRMDIVFVGIIVIGVIGFIMNNSIGLLERRFLRWRKTFC
ncbi:MAG: ABC transporter permease [Candidatus Omnitrophica bacterium]|nr:ABC transporter permease [Candidatus Omnitrophota bacterium]